MSLSPRTQAILLLTGHFSKAADVAKPLTNSEWARLVGWLRQKEASPEQLLTADFEEILDGFNDERISTRRLFELLSRGSSLALATEKWLRAGLWIMTRSDDDYPRRLKERLRTDAPPLLFGCGKRSLLDDGGVGIVGSRNVDASGIEYTRKLATKVSSDGYSVVSGGAKGVDESAMLGALEADGTSVGVLANGLLKAATSSKYRKHLMRGNLALVSTFSPEAGFNVGNAMQRNKYVYCLADACVVVASDTKGGTWTGAIENLKNGWVPLWVRKGGSLGNSRIVERGGRWLSPVEELSIGTLSAVPVGGPPPLFPESDADMGQVAEPNVPTIVKSRMLYDHFIVRVAELTTKEPREPAQLKEDLDLETPQLDAWLKRGVAEGRLKKLTKPLRYQAAPGFDLQVDLFDTSED